MNDPTPLTARASRFVSAVSAGAAAVAMGTKASRALRFNSPRAPLSPFSRERARSQAAAVSPKAASCSSRSISTARTDLLTALM